MRANVPGRPVNEIHRNVAMEILRPPNKNSERSIVLQLVLWSFAGFYVVGHGCNSLQPRGVDLSKG